LEAPWNGHHWNQQKNYVGIRNIAVWVESESYSTDLVGIRIIPLGLFCTSKHSTNHREHTPKTEALPGVDKEAHRQRVGEGRGKFLRQQHDLVMKEA